MHLYEIYHPLSALFSALSPAFRSEAGRKNSAFSSELDALKDGIWLSAKPKA